MKRFALCILCLTGLLFSAATTQGEESKQVLFYLDQSRLIALEFQITVNGKTIEEVWKETLDKRFKGIDKNQDGKIEGEERGELPDVRLLAFLNLNQPAASRPAPAQMNRTAFGDYLKQFGFQPFKINVQPAAGQNTREVSFLGGMQNNPNAAAEKLFGVLDDDADGKLSSAEIKHALDSLAKQDFDQDETISTAELVPTNYAQFFVSPSYTSPSAPQTSFLSVTDRASYRTAAMQLTAKYDTKENDKALSQEEVGINQESFAEHDIDSNGKWDFEEIQQYLRSPKADVIVRIQMGLPNKPKAANVAFEHGEGLGSEVKNAIGSLNLDSVQMEVGVNPSYIADLTSSLKGQLLARDLDKNGYLDKEEIQNQGAARAVLNQLDKDGDGKLFPEEFLEGALPVAQLLSQQIELNVSDRGRDLFRILDGNGDSRLSTRELWAMPNRAALWDKDNDGQISLTDVPQQFRLVAERGEVNFFSRTSGLVVVNTFTGSRVQSAPSTAGGPMWFQKMDRNSDGDVSPKEFLGALDEFKKLDKDADGLISANEATAS